MGPRLPALFAALSLAGRLATAAAPPSILRAAVTDALLAQGADPAPFLAAEAAFPVPQPDGSIAAVETTLGEHLDAISPRTVASGGIGGTREATVGDFFHFYVNVASGNALGYSVSASSAPATPAVYLPAPAAGYAFDVGGTTKNVRGAYSFGYHSAGTLIGSNVDTAASGPYAPIVSGTWVPDSRVDFAGHAVVGETQWCFYGLCVATGAMLATGAATWDSTAAPLPTIP